MFTKTEDRRRESTLELPFAESADRPLLERVPERRHGVRTWRREHLDADLEPVQVDEPDWDAFGDE